MAETANVDELIRRRYVTKSGMVVTFRKLGPGGIQVLWPGEPEDTPEADLQEVEEWVSAILTAEATTTRAKDQSQVMLEYREFLRGLHG